MHDRLRQVGRNGLTFFPEANPYDDLTATSTRVVISHGAGPHHRACGRSVTSRCYADQRPRPARAGNVVAGGELGDTQRITVVPALRPTPSLGDAPGCPGTGGRIAASTSAHSSPQIHGSAVPRPFGELDHPFRAPPQAGHHEPDPRELMAPSRTRTSTSAGTRTSPRCGVVWAGTSFYNHARLHQAFGYRTPAAIYETADPRDLRLSLRAGGR
jgi:hypothetical protein